MTESTLAEQAGYLIGVAGRAPSVHNTQPWRFTVGEDAIELHADPARQLRVDPDGREMLISCGAALYGLRLAVRSLGRLPEVELFPGATALARVRLGSVAPMTVLERKMLAAVSHRHTHRGGFDTAPLPAGLLASLQEDARSEGAALGVIGSGTARRKLAEIAAAAARGQDRDPQARAEMWLWTRGAASPARDGVPAYAFPARSAAQAGRMPQRDFDLGRGVGQLAADGPGAPVTAALYTAGDGEADWLRAGQGLYRLLLRAASQWVFACLNTQPLEEAATRAMIRDALRLPGSPQMLLQLGVSRIAHATARRSAADVTGI